MFNTIAELKQANKDAGMYFFSKDTMNFFASRIESSLYKNQCFITSEKKCFNDYTRVYSVRRARPDASIETLEKDFACIESAREYIKQI
jgi:hypothetical protein